MPPDRTSLHTSSSRWVPAELTEQGITIEQALRAVTLEPARQQRLDRYIGSIEKGKVADLVILDKNPLRQAPNKIHCIRVLSTFVGGSPHDWSKEPVKLAADCQP